MYGTHASEDARINAKCVTTRYHGQRRADVKYYKVDTPASRYRAPPPNGERRLLFSLRLRHVSAPGPRRSCQSCDDKTPQSCDARRWCVSVCRERAAPHTPRSDSEPRRRDLPGLRYPRPCHVVAQNPLPLCPLAGGRTAPRPESSRHLGRAPPAWKTDSSPIVPRSWEARAQLIATDCH